MTNLLLMYSLVSQCKDKQKSLILSFYFPSPQDNLWFSVIHKRRATSMFDDFLKKLLS